MAELRVLCEQGLGCDWGLGAKFLDVSKNEEELPHGEVRHLLHQVRWQLPAGQGCRRCLCCNTLETEMQLPAEGQRRPAVHLARRANWTSWQRCPDTRRR